jgi:hypothetical protein
VRSTENTQNGSYCISRKRTYPRSHSTMLHAPGVLYTLRTSEHKQSLATHQTITCAEYRKAHTPRGTLYSRFYNYQSTHWPEGVHTGKNTQRFCLALCLDCCMEILVSSIQVQNCSFSFQATIKTKLSVNETNNRMTNNTGGILTSKQ